MTMGDYDEAYKHLQLAIRYEPNLIDNFLYMGQLLFMMGNPGEGDVMFERARQMNPEDPHVHKGLAYARLYHEDVSGAFPHLLKWLGETEVNETVVKEAIRFSLALKNENLALHIEAIGLDAGYLKERVLKRVTADPSENPAAPPQSEHPKP
jgi:tetratricopeptide (TPR) repeat protein